MAEDKDKEDDKDEEDGPKEPYGAQVLKAFAADAASLHKTYADHHAQLEGTGAKSCMKRCLKYIRKGMEHVGKTWDAHYKSLGKLKMEMPKDMDESEDDDDQDEEEEEDDEEARKKKSMTAAQAPPTPDADADISEADAMQVRELLAGLKDQLTGLKQAVGISPKT